MWKCMMIHLHISSNNNITSACDWEKCCSFLHTDPWPLAYLPGSSSLMLSLQLLQNVYKSFPQIDTCITRLIQRIHGNNAGLYFNSTIMVLLYNGSQYNRQDEGYLYLWEALQMGILCDIFCDLVLVAFHCRCVSIMQPHCNDK